MSSPGLLTPLSVGVVGLGRIGWDFHCKIISRLPGYDLRAACDLNEDYRREAEDKFGVATYSSTEAMLAAHRLDVVAVALPTHLHRETALLALAHGCHVVLEKPAALNAQEAGEIFAEAKRRRRVITVYQPSRCMRSHRRLAEVLAAKELGDIHLARRSSHSFTRRSDWQALKRYGGGSLMNTGAHLIDQAVAHWGRDLSVKFARTRRIFTLGDADDYVLVVLETAAGITIEIEVSPAALDPGAVPLFAIYGSKGNYLQQDELNRFLRLDGSAIPPRQMDEGLRAANRLYLSETPPLETETIIEPTWTSEDPWFYENFRSVIAGQEPLITPPEDTLAVMRIIDDVRRYTRG